MEENKEKSQQTILDDIHTKIKSEKDLGLDDPKIRLKVIRELCDFHIPSDILDYFIDIKIKRDGLSLNSYILPLSFFLFVYFSVFLTLLPLINSIFVPESNFHFIPLRALFLDGVEKGIPLLVMQWGFLGGLVYTSISLLSRFIRKDLPPMAYYNASFRILLSGVAAIIVFLLYQIYHPSNITNDPAASPYLVLLICFSIGIAPIQFLIRSVDIILSHFMEFWRHKDTSGKRSLTNIEGIDSITAQRLSEEGYDYIQQLALCDPIDLSFKTKFHIHMVKDWKDQALLYLLTADILVTKNESVKKERKRYLNCVLNEAYGIRRFSQLYHLAHDFFKKPVSKEEISKGNFMENGFYDFCKGLGIAESDFPKFKYLVQSLLKTGYSISELYYKYESKSFIRD